MRPPSKETDNGNNRQPHDPDENHLPTTNSALLPNPPETTAGTTDCGHNILTNNQSSQSTNSSNSTTPTPTPAAQTSQSNLTHVAPQHQPPASAQHQGQALLPLMQINADYYQQAGPYGPLPSQYGPPGQIPYPYMTPPIDYMPNHADGLVTMPMMPPLSMAHLPMSGMAPKQALNPSLVSPGHINPNNPNETGKKGERL